MERFFNYSRLLADGTPVGGATVTVYDAGTLNLSTIYSDDLLTPKANPFVADANGFLFFYAANGRYDVRISGGTIPAPYTWGDVELSDYVSLNGLTTPTQVFAVGVAGNDFNIVSAVSTHTFNLPDASGTKRGAVTTGAQSFAGAKTFLTPIAAGSGGTGLDASAAANGQLLIGNGAGFSLGSIGGTANQITVTSGAGSITLSLPQNIHSAATPTFAGLTLSGLTPNAAIYVGAAGILVSTAALADGQLLIGRTGNVPLAANLIAGAGITITNGAGSITIANSATSLSSLNGMTGATQTFATGTSGADFAISSAGDVHTFNIPDAGAAARGLVTTGAQSFAGNKTFTGTTVFSGRVTITPRKPLADDFTDHATSGTGATDVWTISVPGGTVANGEALIVEAYGDLTGDANAKTFTFTLGSTSINVGSPTGNFSSYKMRLIIARVSASVQRVWTDLNEGLVVGNIGVYAAWTENMDNPLTLKITLTHATSGTTTQRVVRTWVEPAS